MLGAIEVRLALTCEACGTSLPVNGPVPLVKCSRCMEITRLDGDRFGWRPVLLQSFVRAVHADRDPEPQRTETAELRLITRLAWPPCAACGKLHEARRIKLAMMKKAPIQCTCGVALELAPVPSQFAAAFPYVKGLVDAEVFDDTPGPAAPKSTAPVVMACMSCAATLPVDGTHRLVECDYCKARNYLPDDLWLSLHPAIKREAWFIVFDEDDVLASLGR